MTLLRSSRLRHTTRTDNSIFWRRIGHLFLSITRISAPGTYYSCYCTSSISYNTTPARAGRRRKHPACRTKHTCSCSHRTSECLWESLSFSSFENLLSSHCTRTYLKNAHAKAPRQQSWNYELKTLVFAALREILILSKCF